ncbi:MAG: DNA repair protein RecN, partial [Myxococcota bacterium]
APELGELEALASERERLRAVDELSAGLHATELALYSGEGAAVNGLGRAARDLQRLSAIDGALLPYAEAAERLGSEVEDLARCVGRQQRSLEADPTRLEEIEVRLDALHRLARKHGGKLSSVFEEAARMEAELDRLGEGDDRREAVEAERAAVQTRFEEALEQLGARRRSGVKRFEVAVARELQALGLPELRIRVQLEELSTPGPSGAERVEILVAPNVGEDLRPLRKTASGGELSRVLLALKRVLAERTEAGVHVFDEIDTGIGGGVAHAVGQRLAGLGAHRQVLVVTHQAPVAAFADVHLLVEKRTSGGRTRTHVYDLDAEGQLAELGRMMGGVASASTRRFAEELRERARGSSAATITPIDRRRRSDSRQAMSVPGVAG